VRIVGVILNPVVSLMGRLSLLNKIMFPSMIVVGSLFSQYLFISLRNSFGDADAVFMVLSLFASILFLYLMFGLYIYLKRLFGNIETTASKLLHGKYEERFAIDTSDESRILLEELNTVNRNNRRILEKLSRSADEILYTSTRLGDNSKQVSERAHQQSDMASAIASAIEEMTETVRLVAEDARVTAEIATNTGELSVKGARDVGYMAESIERLAGSIEETSHTIEDLESKSASINAAVDTISEIADKTNLLALNAAIESARAGEHGRGFAVVADEVRNLAQHASEAATIIQGIITGVQEDISRSYSNMQDSRKQVHESVEVASQAVELLESIRDGAGDSVTRAQGIASATQQQSVAVNEVAVNIARISEYAENNNMTTDETLEIAMHLKNLGSEISGIISQTKGDTK
jgi:methyl-accepting chemotaxis protein